MKSTAIDVRVRVREGVGIIHAISIGIYLLGSISVASILGGIVLQQAFQGSSVSVAAVDSTNSVTLTWSAPGDDANVGTAASYEVRYATDPLSEANWATSTVVANPPTPLLAGSSQAMSVTGLTPGVLYNFAVKTRDEAGNQSAISNIASKRTDLAACVPTWSCTDWSDCRNGTQNRACIDVRTPSCNSNFNRPIEVQTCTTPEPVPSSCSPRWSCSGWTGCVNGVRTRVCQDVNACGGQVGMPTTTYDCSVGGPLPENPSPQFLATVPAQGGSPNLKVYTSAGKRVVNTYALAKSFRGGLSVAGGDVNGDGLGEIMIGTGVGSAPQVSLFTATGKLRLRFFPFPSRLRTGVNVASTDVDGDGRAELIVAPAGSYAPLMRIFRYNAKTNKFVRMMDVSVQGGRFRGGLNLEAGDLDRNGLGNIVVTPATRGRGSTVEVYEYNLTTRKFARVTTFSAYAKSFQSGVATAIGDVDGDGNNEIITSPAPGATDIRVFTYSNRRAVKLSNFMAGASSFRGGADVAALDVNNDGRDDILTISYSNGLPGIRVFSKNIGNNKFSRLTSRFPAFVYSANFLKGVRLAAF